MLLHPTFLIFRPLPPLHRVRVHTFQEHERIVAIVTHNMGLERER